MFNENTVEIIEQYIRNNNKINLDINENKNIDHKLRSSDDHDFSLISNDLDDIKVTADDDDLGFWNNIKKNFSDFKNKIKFNLIQIDNKFKLTEFRYAQIFDQTFDLKIKNDCEGINKFIFNEIIWMSYRNNFEPVIYDKCLYTSDAGWGCMIRAGQMMLANALNMIYSQSDYKRQSKNDVLMLFLDDPIKYKCILDNSCFDYLKHSEENEIINKKESGINIKNSFSHEEFEYVTKVSNFDKEKSLITPPFSIKNILSSSIMYNKGAGDWFSDNEIVKILKELNEKYFPIEGPKILHFDEKIIFLDLIIKECFEKKLCKCANNNFNQDDYAVDEDEDSEFLVINQKYSSSEICECFKDCFPFHNSYYEIKRPLIIFASMRLGLSKLEDVYYKAINDYFKIPNNLGIIGGKGSRALYFIGNCDSNLIFLDPHFVQESVKISDEFSDISASYRPLELFHVESEKMTPCITIGFCFNKSKNLIETIEFIKEYQINNSETIIEVRDFHIKNPIISVYFK